MMSYTIGHLLRVRGAAGMRTLLLLTVLCMLGNRPATAATVMVTLPPLSGLVVMLDAQVQVDCLLPGGADPHHFSLPPKQIEALKAADMLLRTSWDDGGWPIPARHAHQLDLWPQRDHAWLSPKAVATILPRLAERLAALNPDHADAIHAALPTALQRVQATAQAWQQTLSARGVRAVVMQHPAWRRMMADAGVPVLAVLESGHHGGEFTPRQLERALVQINAHPHTWLIANAGHHNNALRWLASHAAVTPPTVTLDALGQCGQPWPALMQGNLDRLRRAP